MEIRTEAGIANPMPLSDLQQYNMRLAYQSKWLKFGVIVVAILGFAFLLLALWLIWYSITNDVINNIVAHCV